ncbi:MAG: M20/M25/M40 family metallo-hydrolase [Deltaproteobacteria bacterium]|nr:M20/M25/M40 family metallo-hydrolase [Deltaproteobacteria bacterium]
MLTRWLGPVSLAALAGLAVWRSLAVAPPDPRPADAPAAEFSAGRALVHVRAVAAEPRPVGSAAHARTREYLLGELRKLGLEPEVQCTPWAGTRYGVPFPVVEVHNVVARLPGRDSTRALALVAHYDSVPQAPGAADDGAGLAALLETARALRVGPPLRNDVLLVATDAEEPGLVGAEAFVAEHPAAAELGLVVNLEARGVRGPVMLFETSPGNARLVEAYGAAVSDPIASSVFYDVARRLGHGTDFAVFKEAGVPGLNLAFGDGVECYHTPCDDVAHLDPASLQHLGDQALALARHFGGLDLRDLRTGDAVFFDVPGGAVVSYGTGWVVPLALLALAAFVAVGFLGLRKRVVTTRNTLLGLAAFLTATVGVSALAWLLWLALRAGHSGLYLMRAGDPYDPGLYRLGFVLFGLALGSSVFALWRSRLELLDLALGSALGWLLLLGASLVLAPGGSHLLTWPLLFQLVALGLLVWRARPEPTSPLEVGTAAACAVPAVVLLAPVVTLAFPALRLPGVAAPTAVIVAGLGLLLPALAFPISREGRWLRLLLVFGATGVLLAAGITNRFDDRRPMPVNLAYALDTTSGQAWWLSDGPELDPWAAHFVGGGEPGPLPEFLAEPASVRRGTAPPVELAAPTVRLLEDSTTDGRRTLRLHVRSPRGAPFVHLIVPPGVPVVGGTVAGRALPPALLPRELPAGFQWGFSFLGAPAEGFEWTFETTATGPVTVTAVDQSPGVPEAPGGATTVRPSHVATARSWLADTTLVRAEHRFATEEE